ncbi:Mu transposase C-terminal domain-containing protein [Burkholderiaceae bacterium UC74_6]
MNSAWHTATELAGLPGLPSSEYRTREWLIRIGVPSRPRAGRGGGQEFDSAHLPAEARKALLARSIILAPALPVPGALEKAPAPETFLPAAPVNAQRPPDQADAAVADARLILLRQIDATGHLVGTTRAVNALVQQLRDGTADQSLMQAAALANQRSRKAGAIAVATLWAWRKDHAERGWVGLLPQPAVKQPLASVAPDVAAVLKNFASAKGHAHNLTEVTQAVIRAQGRPFEEWSKLYHQARRALAKVDKKALIKARHTSADRAARLPFKRRGTENLLPLDIGLVDGHSFKSQVRHPDHGQPFTPEVTLVKDAATRRVTGWSASLSESTWAVGAAITHSATGSGVHAIMYSDNGQGERAKQLDCPVDGLYARLGTDHRTGRPNHPQARGLLERSWRTHMIRAARQFETFQGKDVDRGTLRKVRLELGREQRAVERARKTGELVTLTKRIPTWQQFIDAVQRAIDEYNAQHRHRALPKHTSGPFNGLHMTPDEAWAAMLNPAHQHRPDAMEARMLFQPSVIRVAQRGEVRFLNQLYFNDALMQVDGERVSLRYDIHDPSQVWIWTTSGEFVCEAKLDANRSDFFPKAVVELAREKRVQGMVKRRQQQIDVAMRELNPTLSADMQPTTTLPMVERLDVAPPAELPEVAQAAQAPAAPAAPRRPLFNSPAERFEWLQMHRSEWLEADTAWLRTYVASPAYASLAEYFTGRGLAWEESDASFKSAG